MTALHPGRLVEYTFFGVFVGMGGQTLGILQSEARLGHVTGRFRAIGGIDSDPRACAAYRTLTGSSATCLDLFTAGQYADFHGRPPPEDWHEATPADILAASGGELPDVAGFTPPCKGADARPVGARDLHLHRRGRDSAARRRPGPARRGGLTMDWTSESGLAELERLRAAYDNPPESLYATVAAYSHAAEDATPALVAEIRRLRERESVLLGLLREAPARHSPSCGYLALLSGNVCDCGVNPWKDRRDAALTPGGNDGR